MGTSATRVKDCSRAPALTAILSSRGLGRCLAADESKRGYIKVLRRGEVKMVWSTYNELTCQHMWDIYQHPKGQKEDNQVK